MSTPRAVFCLLSALRAWRAPASSALAGSVSAGTACFSLAKDLPCCCRIFRERIPSTQTHRCPPAPTTRRPPARGRNHSLPLRSSSKSGLKVRQHRDRLSYDDRRPLKSEQRGHPKPRCSNPTTQTPKDSTLPDIAFCATDRSQFSR